MGSPGSMQAPLGVSVQPQPGGYTVAVSGELDVGTIDHLRRVLDSVGSCKERLLTLDLAGVTFMDSCGIHLLTQLAGRATAEGWELTIERVPAAVSRVLTLTGLDTYLPIRA